MIKTGNARENPARVMITGGNGYLGSHLIKRLIADGIEVHAIANKNADRLRDLLPPENIYPIATDFRAIEALVPLIEPQAIYHLAAVHAEPPSFDEIIGMLECSLLLGVALLHGASRCIRRPVFIHAGTYWQFNHGVYAPNTFYAAAKQSLHDLLAYYQTGHGIRSVTLVLYDIFGPNDTRPKLWSKLLEMPPGAVLPVSEGRQYMELVHVDDIAEAFLQAAGLLLARSPLEPLYAVRSEIRITLRELLEAVRTQADLDVQFKWGAIPYWYGQIFEPWQGPVLPGWKASVNPIDGLAELLRYAQSSRRPHHDAGGS